MAFHCGHCNSANVMAGLDKYQCLSCGENTWADGTPAIKEVQPIVPVLVPADMHAGDEFAGQDRRRHPGDPVPQSPNEWPVEPKAEVAPELEPEEEVVPPAPAEMPDLEQLDLSGLTPEQLEAIQLITNPGGE